MSEEREQTTEERPRARRVRQSKFVPLVLLLLMAAIWGILNWNLYEPYRGPCAVADEGGVYVFFDRVLDKDARPQDRTFYLKKSLDGRKFDPKPQRVEGALVSAALDDDGHLVCLFPDFFSVYSRAKQLEREWSASTESLGFEGRYLQRRGSDVFCFGTDKQGNLRAAKLVKTLPSKPSGASGDEKALSFDDRTSWRFVAIESARYEKAAEPPGEPVEHSEDGASVPVPVVWAGAEDATGKLAIFFRVQGQAPEKRGSRYKTEPLPPGKVCLALFDGSTFTSLTKLDDDYPAIAATSVCSVASSSSAGVAPVSTRALVFGTKPGDDPRISCWSLDGTKLSEIESIPYKKGGFFEDQPAVSLATVSLHDRLLLLAQIGGAVKFTTQEKGRWGEWIDIARMPTEARSLLYVYVGSLLLLAGIMIVSGLVALRQRLGNPVRPRELDASTADALVAEALGRGATASAPPPAAPDAPPREGARSSIDRDDGADEDASIPDRFIAFLFDFGFVFLCLLLGGELLQIDVSPRANDDPVRTLAIFAWMTLAFVGYLCISEVLFGRTFGKRIVGLEVRTLQGGTPPLLARLYRNLFRIELLFLATPIPVSIPPWGDQRLPLVPFIALIVMVATPRTQRPGDLVAGTVVQRARSLPMSEEEEDE